MWRKEFHPVVNILLMIGAVIIITLTFFSDESIMMKSLQRICWTIIFIGNLLFYFRKRRMSNSQ